MLYVTAESLAEGAAAHVHVNEIMAGLARRGWSTALIEPAYADGEGRPGPMRRIAAIMDVNRRAGAQLGSSSSNGWHERRMLWRTQLRMLWRMLWRLLWRIQWRDTELRWSSLT